MNLNLTVILSASWMEVVQFKSSYQIEFVKFILFLVTFWLKKFCHYKFFFQNFVYNSLVCHIYFCDTIILPRSIVVVWRKKIVILFFTIFIPTIIVHPQLFLLSNSFLHVFCFNILLTLFFFFKQVVTQILWPKNLVKLVL